MTGTQLSEIRMSLGMSQEEFARALKISRSYIAKNEALKDEEIPHQLAFRANRLRANISSQDGPTDSVVSEKPVIYKKSLISYYDVDAIASPMEVFNDQTVKPTSLINIPGFADCDFAVNVYGHSMYPTIESGMIILCKKVSDKTIILPGEIYFIITPDYRMVKRLKKSDRVGYLMACSDNQNGKNSPDGQTYEPVEIPIDKIIHLYIVRGSIKRHLI